MGLWPWRHDRSCDPVDAQCDKVTGIMNPDGPRRSSGAVGYPEQGDYILGPGGAIDPAAAPTAPCHEHLDIHHDLADGIPLGFESIQCGQRVALPLLESIVQLVAVINELAEALPLVPRKPRDADLRGGPNWDFRFAAFHDGDPRPKVDGWNYLPAPYTPARILPPPIWP